MSSIFIERCERLLNNGVAAQRCYAPGQPLWSEPLLLFRAAAKSSKPLAWTWRTVVLMSEWPMSLISANGPPPLLTAFVAKEGWEHEDPQPLGGWGKIHHLLARRSPDGDSSGLVLSAGDRT